MGMSIFEIIGPVMTGPSSSHTAGMVRIGMMANRIIQEKPKHIGLRLSPKMRSIYSGHRSDAGLFGGTVGMSEDSPGLKDAISIIHEQGIETSVDFFEQGVYPENTAEIRLTTEAGKSFSVTGTSIGGGSIEMLCVDEVPMKLKPDAFHLIVWSLHEADIKKLFTDAELGKMKIQSGLSPKGCSITALSSEEAIPKKIISYFEKSEGSLKLSLVKPVLCYGATKEGAKEYGSLGEACHEAELECISLSELSLRYEMQRSGRSREEIISQMHRHWCCMKESVEKGRGENKLLYDLTGGRDGKKLRTYISEKGSISGGIIPVATADAIGVMEYNGSMGCIVAAPTAGSSGIVPGSMYALKEKFGFSDEEIESALFVSALIGVIMDKRGISFSGSVGGCQAEVGVSSAITAAAIASLFTDDCKIPAHAMALCLKNLLGLVCDPIAGPIEVPCIKRNAVGVANAFISADMAVAGIRSYIPPDEVMDALLDVERRLPPELKSGTVGGLASTCTAKCLRKKLGQMTKQDIEEEGSLK